MKLLIDVGNTRLKYVLVEQAELLDGSSLLTNDITEQWMAEHWQNVSEVVMANVRDPLITIAIEQWAKSREIPCQVVHTEAYRFGVSNGYHVPEQLGVDRWLALLAVNVMYPKKQCLIVDAGTATTVDLISADGQHIGGWILSGVDTLVTSVIAKTRHVFGESKSTDKLSFGLSTPENVAQGSWAATVGLIEQAFKLANAEYGAIDKLIITGGNGEALAKLLPQENEFKSNLVFYGLLRYIAS